MTFIGDYRPTKRVGIEEMDGCIKLLSDKLDEATVNGEADAQIYMGALLTMETIRHGRFEYPHEFIAVLENKINELKGE